MNYDLHKQHNGVFLGVEASFTLIDFLLFFTSFLLGFVFAMFFLIFAIAVLQKIFSRHEFEFNTDDYTATKYYRFFGYFRFKTHKIGFGEIQEFLLSDHESGEALFSQGMNNKKWFTLDIMTGNSILRLAKTEEDEMAHLYELYQELEERLEMYFIFRAEFAAESI